MIDKDKKSLEETKKRVDCFLDRKELETLEKIKKGIEFSMISTIVADIEALKQILFEKGVISKEEHTLILDKEKAHLEERMKFIRGLED